MHQSELGQFALGFPRALLPLNGSLRVALERLRATAQELPFPPQELISALEALGSELAALEERVALERSSVFVFGPAKAGKSTLLDALAAVRVTSPSIFPGYPCALRVRHAPDGSSGLLRFDGSSEPIGGDRGDLKLVLARAHGELVERVRKVRAEGEAFDPARHLQNAIRRVDRALSAPDLESGAFELVECPPIHAPLFPSYAEMMIGEPDHARAGVFVVRASQLSDDAVFDGIEELLAAFDRLLLVINLDARACELSTAGELVPSPERDDPARLISAFEELSTCEPLVAAIRLGRVPVLAIDLLEATRERVFDTESESERTRFTDLTRELSSVLDTHEAFFALTQSALRRAGELADEARNLATSPGLGALSRRRVALVRERASLESVRVALTRLGERERITWEADEFFDGLRTVFSARCGVRAQELARELETSLARVVEDWFADSSSLKDLLDSGLRPRLIAARAELVHTAERVLREELKRAESESRLSTSLRSDLGKARLELGSLLAHCAESAHVLPEFTFVRALDIAAIPVKPRLGQRLIGRAQAEVRRSLFGPPESPVESVSSKVKARRLGEAGRAMMQRSVTARARDILAEEARRIADDLNRSLLDTFLAELERSLERQRLAVDGPSSVLDAAVAELAALGDAFNALETTATRSQSSMGTLGDRCLPAGLLIPVEGPRRASAGAPLDRELEKEPAFD